MILVIAHRLHAGFRAWMGFYCLQNIFMFDLIWSSPCVTGQVGCLFPGCFRRSYFTFLCLSVLICRVHITPGLLSEGSGCGGWGWDGCRLYCAWNVVNQCSGSVPSIISIVLILEMWELRCCGLEVCVFPRFMLKPKSLMCCLYEMGVSGRYLGHEVRSPMMRSVPL
jgi:hypothetical protein